MAGVMWGGAAGAGGPTGAGGPAGAAREVPSVLLGGAEPSVGVGVSFGHSSIPGGVADYVDEGTKLNTGHP